MMSRKQFYRSIVVIVACLFLNGFLLKLNAQSKQLLSLIANPPPGTNAVRFFIDDMQYSELTDLYAVKTKTKPAWKTVIDPAWLDKGAHALRIEATTPSGIKTIETKTIQGTKDQSDVNKISLAGAWDFAEMNELPAGALEGKTPPAVSVGYKEGRWTKIFVPNSLGAVSEKWNKYEGILGVYRRTLDLTFTKNEQVAILLESCYWSGHVFINGIEVGETHGGYLPSRFDISKAAQQGKNEIAIIVDNRFSSMGAFKRINEFYWNWGGLLQEVFIEKHSPVSLIELRAEGDMKGGLQLHITGLNATTSLQEKKISVEVYNATDKKVAGPVSLNLALPAGENIIKLKTLQINNRVLWELEKPYLYTVVVKGDFGTLKERTGFRDIKVSGSDILLNGKVVQGLQGFDRHADYPGLGRTQPDALAYQELKLLRDKGFRFFRPAHYPTTRGQLNAADELGLLVIEEINVTGLKGDVLASKEVKDFAARQLTKMIGRDRSHPSIIAWSVGNENFTEQDGAEEYVSTTIGIGRSLDPTRLFTQVTHRHTTDKTFQYQDFVAQNYYAGWYTKDVNVIPNLLDAVQAYSGNKPILISEYGAETIPGREGTAKASEFYQGYIIDAHNRLLDNRKHFFGKMYWCATDFWCRPNWTGGSPEPIPPFHLKSLISFDREHKKLGWRVIFSPVRLLFNPHTVKGNEFGGDIIMTPGKDTTISQVITVKEIKGKPVKGVVKLDLPKGFTSNTMEYPFELKPDEGRSITITIKGILASTDKSADCFIRAVIDEDTEAQPLLLSLKTKDTVN